MGLQHALSMVKFSYDCLSNVLQMEEIPLW
jgi:hypothetical protein